MSKRYITESEFIKPLKMRFIQMLLAGNMYHFDYNFNQISCEFIGNMYNFKNLSKQHIAKEVYLVKLLIIIIW